MDHTQIKTYEDVCKVLNIEPTMLPDVSMLPEKDRGAIIAHYKLVKVAEALNDGWQPDWSNHNQYKYTAWFEVKASKKVPSGSGFSFSYYVSWYANTDVGSRLCFKSRELALHAGKQFEDLFKEYFLFLN